MKEAVFGYIVLLQCLTSTEIVWFVSDGRFEITLLVALVEAGGLESVLKKKKDLKPETDV